MSIPAYTQRVFKAIHSQRAFNAYAMQHFLRAVSLVALHSTE